MTDATRGESAGTSGWAMAAAACGIGLACPLLSIAAILLGVKALHHVADRPGRRGRGLAKLGIVLGVIGTAAWFGAAFWWDRNARQEMLTGPAPALAAGFDGQVERFVGGFHGATATPAQAQEFLDELTRRYGAYEDIETGESERREGAAMVEGRVTIPYTLRFAWQEIPARARYLVYDPVAGELVLEFESIEVIDVERGNLAFPAGAFADG